MKRIGTALAFVLALLCLSTAGYADQGGRIFNFHGNFASASGDAYENENGDSMTAFDLGATLFHFMTDFVAIGLGASYDRVGQGDHSASTLGVGPQVGVYFNDDWSERTAHPFVRGGWAYGKETWDDGDNSVSETSSTFFFGGGVLSMFTDTVGIFLQGTYTMDTVSPEEGDSVKGSHLLFGAGVTIVLPD